MHHGLVGIPVSDQDKISHCNTNTLSSKHPDVTGDEISGRTVWLEII